MIACCNFYFVSEAPKFKNLIFFWGFFLRGHFSNLHISSVLSIFLDRKNALIFIYDMMILLSENLSGFRNFPDFHQIFRFIHRMDGLLLSYDMMIVFSGKISGLRIFPDFHQIFRFLQRMNNLLLLYDMIIFFSGNLSIFRIFSRFSSNLQIFL